MSGPAERDGMRLLDHWERVTTGPVGSDVESESQRGRVDMCIIYDLRLEKD